MISVNIEDMRSFTSKLFLGDVFDSFLMKEVSISTYNTFTIDGAVKRGYYSKEELEEENIRPYSRWSVVKPFCFSLIKGKRLPVGFRIVLFIGKEEMEDFLSSGSIGGLKDQVNGLYVTIRYEEEKLFCVTGTSLSVFTMDKTIDEEWDEGLKGFLKKNGILFTEESFY